GGRQRAGGFEVLAHRKSGEHATPCRHVANAAQDALLDGKRGSIVAEQQDATRPEAEDGLDQTGLAGAVAAQQGDDLAAFQRELAQLQPCRHAASAKPRKLARTPGLARTAAGGPSAITRPPSRQTRRSHTADSNSMSWSTIRMP